MKSSHVRHLQRLHVILIIIILSILIQTIYCVRNGKTQIVDLLKKKPTASLDNGEEDETFEHTRSDFYGEPSDVEYSAESKDKIPNLTNKATDKEAKTSRNPNFNTSPQERSKPKMLTESLENNDADNDENKDNNNAGNAVDGNKKERKRISKKDSAMKEPSQVFANENVHPEHFEENIDHYDNENQPEENIREQRPEGERDDETTQSPPQPEIYPCQHDVDCPKYGRLAP